jgi:hypothetical protein
MRVALILLAATIALPAAGEGPAPATALPDSPTEIASPCRDDASVPCVMGDAPEPIDEGPVCNEGGTQVDVPDGPPCGSGG